MSKVIAVTGASGGVGRACVREFAQRGDSVALVARGASGLEAAADEARRAGVSAITVPVDVADPEGVDQAVARIEEELGPIDVWVNAAFTSVFAPFDGPNRPPCPGIRTSRPTCGSRRTVRAAMTSAPTVPSTTEPRPEAGSRWWPTTTPKSRQPSPWVPREPRSPQLDRGRRDDRGPAWRASARGEVDGRLTGALLDHVLGLEDPAPTQAQERQQSSLGWPAQS